MLSVCSCGTVETIPAKPENENTKCCNTDIMAEDWSCMTVFVIFTDTRSKEAGADETGDTTNHMNNSGSGKISKAKIG